MNVVAHWTVLEAPQGLLLFVGGLLVGGMLSAGVRWRRNNR